jgi:hypothetical protein
MEAGVATSRMAPGEATVDSRVVGEAAVRGEAATDQESEVEWEAQA